MRFDAAAGSAQEMTIVTCDVRSGRSPEMIEELVREISTIMSRELDVSEARIAIYVTEHATSQFFRDGSRAPDWSPSEALIS